MHHTITKQRSSSHWYTSDVISEDLLIGGKASQLAKLTQWGFPVPRWGVIPVHALHALLPVSGQTQPTVETILSVAFDADWLQDILASFTPNALLAVRSSASVEDGTTASYAGLFHTELGVRPEQLAASIRAVWASAYSKRVEAYQQTQASSPRPEMAIIVQEMIPSEAAGVAFGIDPVSGDRTKRLVNAVWGLGQGLVDGRLNGDTYTLSMDGSIESQIANKESVLKLLPTGELKMVPLAENFRTRPVLVAKHLHQLKDWLEQLYLHTHTYQDIEFAVHGGSLFLLQARPITGVSALADGGGKRQVWDNSNIVESYPGLTLPLTFSFITNMYDAVYRQLVGLLGVQKKEIEANAHVFTNMLGLIQGRVYYNLYGWYKALSLLPGYSLNASFMETMMGVKERFELADHQPLSKWKSYWGIGRMLVRMWNNFRRLPVDTASFLLYVEKVLKAFEAKPIDHMRPVEVMSVYHSVEEVLVKEWKPPLVNDFFAMIFFGLLQKEGEKLGLPHLHNALLSGSRDIISTEPMHLLQQISHHILQDASVETHFKTLSPEALWTRMQQGEFPLIQPMVIDYLNRFGERVTGELKLESITYRQDPARLMAIIQAYVKQGIGQPEETDHDHIRLQAERQVFSALKGKPLKRVWFRFVLKHARSLVSNRENLRYERTRAFGMVRKMFSSIGRTFYANGQLAHPRDIFYLKQEEIFDYIEGKAADTDLKQLVAFRKKQYEGYEVDNPPSRIESFGDPYRIQPAKQQAEVMKGDITGIGCCAGVVRQQVQVVLDPNQLHDLQGRILVCKSTDPGWVPLFPTASGLLVERGSLLSHAAIVAREMGKPCIVGIDQLLERLQTGDWVEMDGRTGQVNLIDAPEDINMPQSASASLKA